VGAAERRRWVAATKAACQLIIFFSGKCLMSTELSSFLRNFFELLGVLSLLSLKLDQLSQDLLEIAPAAASDHFKSGV
jgi:hypothetical protein